HRVVVHGVLWAALAWSGLPSRPCRAEERTPENLALRANASASSEFSPQYAARFACDGVIPPPISHDDAGKAWCAKGAVHDDGVRFVLEWPDPVRVAEIVYYGRTASSWAENWKDYEVYLDDAKEAAAKGSLASGHGPQRITLARPATVKRLALKFLTSYGTDNPGASEIQVYAESPPPDLLGKF